ncbi:MAG: MarR family transcriptional regulator [Bacteroidales bacterium]|jgi:DNA-binding MarR family transcriptional regulator|nr:MarR family transcriptional regulator [Bacteroidales bacterium]
METTQILIKIRKIVRSINLESKKIQKDNGVSIPQILCLDYLSKKHNYKTSQKEIRDFLNLNSSTVTGIVNRLERKGLCLRLPKEDDKRITYITLTSEGRKLLMDIPPLLHDRLSYKLKGLSEDASLEINDALNTIIEYLGVEDVDASPVITV